ELRGREVADRVFRDQQRADRHPIYAGRDVVKEIEVVQIPILRVRREVGDRWRRSKQRVRQGLFEEVGARVRSEDVWVAQNEVLREVCRLADRQHAEGNWAITHAPGVFQTAAHLGPFRLQGAGERGAIKVGARIGDDETWIGRVVVKRGDGLAGSGYRRLGPQVESKPQQRVEGIVGRAQGVVVGAGQHRLKVDTAREKVAGKLWRCDRGSARDANGIGCPGDVGVHRGAVIHDSDGGVIGHAVD